MKFIVVSENEDDLDKDNLLYWKKEIKELSAKQAAQIMWHACKDL